MLKCAASIIIEKTTFRFPKDAKEKQMWLIAIKSYQKIVIHPSSLALVFGHIPGGNLPNHIFKKSWGHIPGGKLRVLPGGFVQDAIFLEGPFKGATCAVLITQS